MIFRFLIIAICLMQLSAWADETCFTDSKGWDQWKEKTARQLIQYRLYSLKADEYRDFKETFEFLEKCKNDPKSWLKAAGLSCTKNIEQYISAGFDHLKFAQRFSQTTLADAGASGSTSSDGKTTYVENDSYSKRVSEKLKFPDWAESKEFKDAVVKKGFSSLRKYIESKNRKISNKDERIRFVQFKGFSFGAPADSPQDRSIIYVPGNPEKIILIRQTQPYKTGEVDPPGSKPCISEPCDVDVDVLGLFHQEGRIISYLRGAGLSGIYPHQPLNHQSSPPGDCFTCHASGPIAIHGPIEAKDQESASFINKRIRMAAGDWNGYNRFSELGPGYGSNSEDAVKRRTDDYLKRCSGGIIDNPVQAAKIRSVMTCTECHNNAGRAVLTPFNTQMMERYITSGLMPPPEHLGDTKLSKQERKALIDCLTDEYDKNFASWLKDKNCQEEEAKATTPILEHLKKLNVEPLSCPQGK